MQNFIYVAMTLFVIHEIYIKFKRDPFNIEGLLNYCSEPS